MLAWVVLGSAITLVVAFAVTTNYYRRRARKAERRSSPLSRTKRSPVPSSAETYLSQKQKQAINSKAAHHIHENKFLFPFEIFLWVNVLYFNKISDSDFKMSQDFYILIIYLNPEL